MINMIKVFLGENSRVVDFIWVNQGKCFLPDANKYTHTIYNFTYIQFFFVTIVSKAWYSLNILYNKVII